MTRREWLACTAAAGLLKAAPAAPTAPVSIAKCSSYDGDLVSTLSTMFDQLGGLGRIVRNKTVTIKLNLTGSPGLRFQGKALGVTHYTHPKLVFAMARVLNTAGAKRIRFVESAWASGGPLEEYMLDSGWNARALLSLVPDLCAARPVDIAFIDGIESVSGGEGPWIKGLKLVQPGVLIAGTNPVTTDAVATGVMGYDPQAQKGTRPFVTCDNTLLLAEGHGIGTTDLKRIEVRGVSIAQALYRFDA